MKIFVSLPFFNEEQLGVYNEITGLVKTNLPTAELVELKDSELQDITPLNDKIAAITKSVIHHFQSGEAPVKVILGYKNPTDLGGIFEKMSALRKNCGSVLVVTEEELLAQDFGMVLGKLSTGDYLVTTSKLFIDGVSELRSLNIIDKLQDENADTYIYIKDAFTAIDIAVSLGLQKTTISLTEKKDFFAYITALVMQGVPQQVLIEHMTSSGIVVSPVILGMIKGVEDYVVEFTESQLEEGLAADKDLKSLK